MEKEFRTIFSDFGDQANGFFSFDYQMVMHRMCMDIDNLQGLLNIRMVEDGKSKREAIQN